VKVEAIPSPKRQFELGLYGAKPQKVSTIDTAIKAFLKTVFFEHASY
jgi:hypothetical protein